MSQSVKAPFKFSYTQPSLEQWGIENLEMEGSE